MKIWFAGVLLGALVAGSASADTVETQQKNLEKYTPYLQDAVSEVRFWSLYKWQLVGPDKLVVWSNTRDAYLLGVEQPCTGLQWAKGIGVTSKQRRTLSQRLDEIKVGRDRCRITEIRPIDTKRMNTDRAAKK